MAGLAGRDREVAAVEAFLDDDGADGARVLLLQGEAGIGKTTLLRAGIESARARGLRVLSCAPAAAEAQLAFTGLRDLLTGAFDKVSAALTRPQRVALEVVLLREEPAERPPDQGTIAVAVLAAVRALAVAGPMLLAVDDVQWLDAASVAPLAYAFRRLDAGRISVLLSHRLDGDKRMPPLLDGLDRERISVLRVESLTLGALARIVHERLGVALPRRVLHRVHEISGGNPFFALELARGLATSSPGHDAVIPVPPTLQELVHGRLEALPRETIEVLQYASALSRPTLATSARALGGDPLTAFAPAVDAQVVQIDGDSIRFEHPLFAAAVYGLGTPTQRRELHLRLAAIVADAEERAHHLALGTHTPDRDVAAELEDTALAVRTRGAPAVCADLFAAAARLTPALDAEERIRRTLFAAESAFEAGESERAQALLEPLLDEDLPPPVRGQVLAQLAWVFADTSRIPHAMRLWAEALELVTDPVAVVDIRAGMAIMSIYGGTTSAALEHIDRAVVAAEASGDAERHARMLGVRGLVGSLAGDRAFGEYIQRALHLEPELDAAPSIWSPTMTAAESARFTFDLDAAARGYRVLIEQGLDTGNVELECWATFGLARTELLLGNYDSARELSDAALELAEAMGRWQLPTRTLRAELDGIVGRRDAAESGLRAVIVDAERLRETRWLRQARAALGRTALAHGDFDTAADELREARGLGDEAEMRHPAVSVALMDEVEAAVAAGRPDQANEAQAALGADSSTRLLPFVLRAEAAVLAGRGEHRPAERALVRALELQAPEFMPLQRARTLLALGSTRRRMRQRRAARETLGEALAIFEALRARPWIERTRDELARIGGRSAGEGLTPSERKIATLVAAGKKNKEVAAELVITERTVESALTQIYRKLDVRSRTELARVFTQSE